MLIRRYSTTAKELWVIFPYNMIINIFVTKSLAHVRSLSDMKIFQVLFGGIHASLS